MLKFLPFLCLVLLGLVACSRYEDEVMPAKVGGKTVLTNDSFIVYKNQRLRLNVLANDTLQTDGMLLFGRASHGTISADSAGFVYRPQLNYLGTDHFYYKYCTDAVCDSALVTIAVIEPVAGCQPVANHDFTTYQVFTPVTFPVLANDITCGPVTLTIVKQPVQGSAQVLAGNEVRYTPNAGYAGPDSLVYEFSTPDGRRARAIFSVSSVPNCTLVAHPDAAETFMNDTLTIYPLLNDSTCQGPVQLTILNGPQRGTARVLTNNRITFKPDHNYVGPDQLEYQICRTSGPCARGIINITVKAPNINCLTGFTARNDSIPLPPGTTATSFFFNVLANDTYCPNQLISLSIIPPFAQYGSALPVMHNGTIHINYLKTNSPGPAYTDLIRYEIRMNVNGQTVSRTAQVQVIFR